MSGWDDLDRLLFSAARTEEDLTALPPEIRMTVTKRGARLPLTTDQAMDEGLIPDTRPARPRRTPVRVTSVTIARAVVRDSVAGVRLRAGSWVAGVDLAERDEDEAEEWA